MSVGFKVCFTKKTSTWTFKTSFLQNIPSESYIIEEEPHKYFLFRREVKLPGGFPPPKKWVLHSFQCQSLVSNFWFVTLRGVQKLDKFIFLVIYVDTKFPKVLSVGLPNICKFLPKLQLSP